MRRFVMSLAFRIVCPYCAEPTRAPAEAFFYRWWPSEDGELAVALHDPTAAAAVASCCPDCEGLVSLLVEGKDSILRPIMAEDIDSSDWGHFQADLTLKSYFPERPGIALSDAVPESIRSCFPDLLEDVSRKRNAAASLVTCGAILEVALKALEEQAGLSMIRRMTLIERIDRLKGAGIITTSVADWAHEIRLDRNAGAHELLGDPSLALAYANFLRIFIEMGFEWPRQIRAVNAHKQTNRRSPRGKSAG